MQQQINAVLDAAGAVKAATQLVSTRADLPACQQFIDALDTLEACAENLRRTPAMPSVKALWERRVTVETIFMPSAYFDAQYNGEALSELVEELRERGSAGVPRAVTDLVCELINRQEFNGLIARVSMYRSASTHFGGVVAAEDIEALASRAAEWGSYVLRTQNDSSNTVIELAAHRDQKAA